MRDALDNTSVTCILTGTNTWTRRWVRYEIARSLVRGNGILNVNIHGVQDNSKRTSEQGSNPLDAIGVYRSENAIYLAEWENGKWIEYSDYTRSIPAGDLWFDPPTSDNTVVALSQHCMSYDFTQQNGRKNIGGWIDLAAERAGR